MIVNPDRSSFGARAANTIDKILGNVNGFLMKEHNQDGTHGAITATSATVAGPLALTTFLNIEAKAQLNNVNAPGVTVLRINCTGAQNITGIDSIDRVMGSLVMICNVTDTVDHLTILLNDTGSIARNRFRGDPALGGDSIDLAPGRFLWAMYDSVSLRWRVGTGFG